MNVRPERRITHCCVTYVLGIEAHMGRIVRTANVDRKESPILDIIYAESPLPSSDHDVAVDGGPVQVQREEPLEINFANLSSSVYVPEAYGPVMRPRCDKMGALF